ncbi:hypothetical protein K0U00_37130, partial [Paenibacillus sepulcri]|nr:hypothetical protein [Paenibacillus sepulcri]
MTTLTWTEAAPGVWRTRIGDSQALSPLALVGAVPRMKALERMAQAAPPFQWNDIRVEAAGGGRRLLVL